MDITGLPEAMYKAYGEVTDFKNYQGLPMPKWEALTPIIQKAWGAAAVCAVERALRESPPTPSFDAREQAQITHAVDYAENHSSAGVPGHGQFMLIAKFAKAIGLS